LICLAVKGSLLDAYSQFPALAGVDPLLQGELGPQYGRRNEATIQAGYLVKGFMEGQGYQEMGTVNKRPRMTPRIASPEDVTFA